MAVYFVTGKLGSGKTLASVGRMRDKLLAGCPVATNIDLRLTKLIGATSRKAVVYRLPDKPGIADFEAIGIGNLTYDEEKNGLIVLDECGTWFNSRSWQDKSRQEVINWFLHARKKGWDIIFLVQSIEIVDKQAREALAEHVVTCMRTDRLPVPIIGGVLKLLSGFRVQMPKVHVGVVRYGDRDTSLIVDRWWYRGRDLYSSYDTKQIFRQTDNGTQQMLPPWLIKGRYMKPKGIDLKNRARRLALRYPLAASISAAVVFSSAVVAHVRSGDVARLAELTPAAIVSTPSDLPANETKHLPPDWAAGVHIVGVVDFGWYKKPILADASGNELSLDQFNSEGIRFRIVSNCAGKLYSDNWSQDVTCFQKRVETSKNDLLGSRQSDDLPPSNTQPSL